jgi:hypothetical protein
VPATTSKTTIVNPIVRPYFIAALWPSPAGMPILMKVEPESEIRQMDGWQLVAGLVWAYFSPTDNQCPKRPSTDVRIALD